MIEKLYRVIPTWVLITGNILGWGFILVDAFIWKLH